MCIINKLKRVLIKTELIQTSRDLIALCSPVFWSILFQLYQSIYDSIALEYHELTNQFPAPDTQLFLLEFEDYKGIFRYMGLLSTLVLLQQLSERNEGKGYSVILSAFQAAWIQIQKVVILIALPAYHFLKCFHDSLT